jgi:hypothetical protein
MNEGENETKNTTTIAISIWLKFSSGNKNLHIEINNY